MIISDFDIVLFGGTGDLAMRKLLPALYARDFSNELMPNVRVICIGRGKKNNNNFREIIKQNVKLYIYQNLINSNILERFCKRIQYISLNAKDSTEYKNLVAAIRLNPMLPHIFYLATPPTLFSMICDNLSQVGLITLNTRVVLEKPLGHNLKSAKNINAQVSRYFNESQIFRIDHYLGKEAVQNLLALRFGNILFEPLWRREWISDVQITIAEELGVGGRFDYYDASGALRDMLQNHLLQLLCIVAMEPPISNSADAVRDEKLKVLRSLKRFTASTLAMNVVRGQYCSGYIRGIAVPSYCQEYDSNPYSCTETFVAIKAEIDTWRWAGVPFYLRTGKRMANQLAEIVVRFKSVPHSIFTQHNRNMPNCLAIQLQPEEGLYMNLMAKTPGDGMFLKPVELALDFREKFKAPRMEAYERLLLDVLRSQLTLFMRSDELEAAWEWIEPILEYWKKEKSKPILYNSGTWGPTEANALIKRDGLQWREEIKYIKCLYKNI